MMDDIEDPPYDLWDHRFAVEPPLPLTVVAAAGGFVMAAGGALLVIDPGERALRKRDLEPGPAPAAVAIEPWAPHRQALAVGGTVSVFEGPWPGDPILDFVLSDPTDAVTHLGWARHAGESRLYLRQRSGQVSRIGMGGLAEVMNTPHASAIGADADGVLGLISLLPDDEANAWILPVEATSWDIRSLTMVPVGSDGDAASNWTVQLSVCGKAFAFSLDEWGAMVSWEENEDDSKHFELPPTVFEGPLAFGSERVLFAAYNVEGQVRILRYERNVGVTCIARFGVGDDWEGVPATVTSLAWDASRRSLWAASPELGLIEMTEPSEQAKKYRLN